MVFACLNSLSRRDLPRRDLGCRPRAVLDQGRACHAWNDGPTLVRKPVLHKKILHHHCPKNWSLLMTNFCFYFSSVWQTILTLFVTDDVCPKNW